MEPNSYVPLIAALVALALVPSAMAAKARPQRTLAAAGATLTVDNDRQQCPNAGYTRIRDAIDAARPGDTIAVCEGTYQEGPGTPGSTALTITKSLSIRGAGADKVTVEPTHKRELRIAENPAVIDQPFGAGHAIMLGFDPWFRAWTTQEERLVLDGVLYPTGSAIPAGSTSMNAKVEALHAAAPSAPIATTRLPRVKARPVLEAHSTGRDVRLRVRPAKARALRAAVKSADLPGRIRSRIRFVHGHASYDVVVRGARTGSLGRRSGWESALLAAIARHHLPLLPSAI